MRTFTHPPSTPARSVVRAAMAALCFAVASNALPQAASAMTQAAPPISVDGSAVGVPALERNGRVFVPVRGVFEKLGASVDFTPPASIDARQHGRDLAKLAVGNRSATVRGAQQTLDVAPFLSGGHAMVPLRLISEAAGATVAYAQNPRSIRITQAVAAAPAAAATADAAAQAPQERHGIPWWVWLLAALVLLGIILALTRRKKDPVIATSSTGRRADPTIKTRK